MKASKLLTFGVIGLAVVALGLYLKKGDMVGTKLVGGEKIAEVMKAGGSTYCVMETSEGGKIETWTKDKKVKVYGLNTGGGAGMGYMISDGEWTYMWVEGEAEGTKYPVMDEETPRSEGEGFAGEMPDADMQQEMEEYQVDTADFEYDCSEQNIPDSTFIPPANIKFVDVMEKMGVSLEDLKQE